MSAAGIAKAVAMRLGQAILTLAIVVTIVFVLVRLIPGNPVETILGTDATPEAEAALREQLGIDRPIPEQLLDYALGLLRGDLGVSAIQQGVPVTQIIASALPITMAIAASGLVLGGLVGTALGLWAALSNNRRVDMIVRGWAILFYATPTFLVALVLILIFAVTMNWLPAGGWPGRYPENLLYLALPALALSSHLAPAVARTARQAALDIGSQSFIEASLARGLPGWRLNLFHVLPNAMLPVVTLMAVNFGALLTGAIIVEAVFGIVGLGTELTRAVTTRDYPVVVGTALISAAAVIIGNMLGDLAVAAIDPRARRR